MKVNTDIKFDNKLIEAFGRGLKYAILDDNNTIRHIPVRCKDYFQDIYWAEIMQRSNVSQYGFDWNGKNDNPISKLKRVNILLMNDVPESLDGKNIINLLKPFEQALNIEYSDYITVDDKLDQVVINYSNDWAKHPYLLSVFLLLIRIGSKYTNKANKKEVLEWLKEDVYKVCLQSDQSILLFINKYNLLERLIDEKTLGNQQWEYYENSENIHNYSGIIGYCESDYYKVLMNTDEEMFEDEDEGEDGIGMDLDLIEF